jgi:CheY-like chemotaxis protein
MSSPACCPNSVLVIEDDDISRRTLEVMLQAAGFEVATVENGRQALNYLRQNERPACILLDLLMPVMDGWEFRERQLADSALASIPVLVITALSERGRQTPALRGVPIVPKPFALNELVDAVRSLCE